MNIMNMTRLSRVRNGSHWNRPSAIVSIMFRHSATITFAILVGVGGGDAAATPAPHPFRDVLIGHVCQGATGFDDLPRYLAIDEHDQLLVLRYQKSGVKRIRSKQRE